MCAAFVRNATRFASRLMATLAAADNIVCVKKTILLYGLLGGVLITVLKLTEYRFLVVEHSVELYGGLIALLFSVVGIWLGLKLTKTKETVVVREVEVLVPVQT